MCICKPARRLLRLALEYFWISLQCCRTFVEELPGHSQVTCSKSPSLTAHAVACSWVYCNLLFRIIGALDFLHKVTYIVLSKVNVNCGMMFWHGFFQKANLIILLRDSLRMTRECYVHAFSSFSIIRSFFHYLFIKCCFFNQCIKV